MPDLHVDAPIFFEALASAAVCSPADAVEHYGELEAGPHPVDTFLTEFGVHPDAPGE